MKDIKVNDLDETKKSAEVEMTEEELNQVKGGGLLLPAVQKVREAARSTTTTAKLGDGSVRTFNGAQGDEGSM